MLEMIYFDKLAYVETLKEAGVTDIHAKAFANAQYKSLSQCIDNTLAIKSDLMGVKSELKEVIQKEKTALKAEIQVLITDLHEVKSDVKLLKWMIGATMTGMFALLTGVGEVIGKMLFNI